VRNAVRSAKERQMKRSTFLSTATSASALAVAPAVVAADTPSADAPAAAIPVSGEAVPGLAAFDRVMLALLKRWNVPGGQCAVSRNGRLAYSRGFGYVDNPPGSSTPPVSPTARFRIASSTKPITAVAIMRLVEARRLRLDERAFEILSDFAPPPGTTADPRLKTITVRHLLEHSGGFVYPDAAGFDPQFDALRLAADAFGRPRPAAPADIIRWVMGRPPAFTPGTQFTYSNLGYNILGRIIEHRTQLPYSDALKLLVFNPAGAASIEFMTRSSPSARLPDEVFYFDGAVQTGGYSIYDDDPNVRMYSYGGFDGRAIDAHGGAIANAPDLTRFLDAVHGSTGTQLLSKESLATMLAPPGYPHAPGKYYALGWNVDTARKIVMSHNGAITFGTCSSIFRFAGGVTLAALFNHLDPDVRGMVGDVETQLPQAVFSVERWPS
jgi:CubicO group peptidase (beta-lactamase class C family)